ncbi:MAG: hypothetical protein KDI83_09125 [Gammaproteobacteria bacterium]|nr:hypothetical protein [Gammaproteobacteria bacterium]
MSLVRRTMALLLTLMLAGCEAGQALDLAQFNNLKYVHGETGQSQSQSVAGATTLQRLGQWLDQNRDGWQPLQATLLPGGITIYGDRFDLRVVQQTVILRYRKPTGEQQQLHKKLPAELFAQLISH